MPTSSKNEPECVSTKLSKALRLAKRDNNIKQVIILHKTYDAYYRSTDGTETFTKAVVEFSNACNGLLCKDIVSHILSFIDFEWVFYNSEPFKRVRLLEEEQFIARSQNGTNIGIISTLDKYLLVISFNRRDQRALCSFAELCNELSN